MGIATHWVSFGSIWSRCASDSRGSCGPRGASITFLAHFAFVSLDIKATGCLVMHAGSKTNEKRGNRKTLLTGGPVSPTFPGFPASPSSPYTDSKKDRKKRRKKKESKRPSIIFRLTCLRSYRGSTLQQINTTSPINHKSTFTYTQWEVYLFSHHSWLAHSARHALRTLATQNKTESVSYIMHARLSPLLADCWHYSDGITDYRACSLCICNHILLS